MSNYNQVGQGKPEQKQQGNKLGEGQNPSPKPGQQAELPDQTEQKSQTSDEHGKGGGIDEERGLIHQLPGGESG